MSEATEQADIGKPAGGGPTAIVAEQEPLKTVPIGSEHRTDKFSCAKSARVASFFTQEYQIWVPQNYCRVFVLPNPEDETHIWGFYTLAPSALVRSKARNKEQRKIPGGIPIPMILIGFMGRNDDAPKGVGEALIVDAARRVHRTPDIPAWGLMLDSEDGPKNEKLWNWYQAQGFQPAKADPDNPDSGVMYASLSWLIPELHDAANSR
jgi:hypothetical protein